MRVLSVNVGRPRDVAWRGKAVRTSIFKDPVAGAVAVRTLNLDGDGQADLSVHGGRDKAVYAYPSEHYAFWQRELEMDSLPWGAFGENLTTQGLDENGVCIGDQLRCGSAEFVVTQPRVPCYKLGVRFDRPDLVKRFLRSGRSGFYLAVTREGELRTGDAIEVVAAAGDRVSIAEMNAIYTADAPDRDQIARLIALPALAEAWRSHFRALLEG
jgi:MOSC domain-containing protein YiiM